MTKDEIERYARHIMLKEIGGPGQQRLLAASVSIIGAGGLGGPCAMYLAAAGVGRIEILDDDVVSLSNLQRQIQFATADIGRPKAVVLAERLRAINPGVEAAWRSERFADGTRLAGDVLIDASDNFTTRLSLNRMAHETRRPLVSGAVAAWAAQIAVFDSGRCPETPCYQCLVPELPPNAATCAQTGIIGALTGMVGARMALEVVRYVTDASAVPLGRLEVIDALGATNRTVRLPKDEDCPVCNRKGHLAAGDS